MVEAKMDVETEFDYKNKYKAAIKILCCDICTLYTGFFLKKLNLYKFDNFIFLRWQE